MGLLSYIVNRALLATGQSSGAAACDQRSQQIATSSPSYFLQSTPADSDISVGAVDGFYASADCNVVVRGLHNSSNITLTGIKGGSWNPGQFIRIVSTTAGVITYCWFQKPEA